MITTGNKTAAGSANGTRKSGTNTANKKNAIRGCLTRYPHIIAVQANKEMQK
ncbi:MAG: hypothetical protein LBN24_04990 [Mediterranea sp.]|nr:hypothetical protein [Mediterranea sp.]